MASLRRTAAALLLIAAFMPGLLAPAPAGAQSAPAESEKSGLVENLGRGLSAVWDTVKGWFSWIGRLFGLGRPSGLAEGSSCLSTAECGDGLLCLNTCPGGGDDCQAFRKSCRSADESFEIGEDGKVRVVVQQAFAGCGATDLCAEGTFCTRTCPEGVACETTHRCLALSGPTASCSASADCSAACGELDLAEGLAVVASCVEGGCRCEYEEYDPDLEVAACPAAALQKNLLCPEGTRAICTMEGCSGGDCAPRRTCLTAPAFGGQCVYDSGCASVSCPEETEPFCGSDRLCHCRRVVEEVVTCQAESDCSGVSCPDGSSSACAEGVCVCARTTAVDQGNACSADGDCSGISCQEGFAPACVDGACACQRTREGAVSCSVVADCGGISCPEDFEKACLDGTCACTRTTFE